MALTVDRHVPVAPEQLLAMIRTRAAYWQESRVPSELHSKGVFGVDARIKGSRFALTLQELGRDPAASPYQLVGTVSAESSGSRIQARVTRLPGARWGWTFVGVLGLWLLVAGATTGDRVAGAAIIVVGGLMTWRSQRGEEMLTTQDDRGAAHLLDRLEEALAAASALAAARHENQL